jgi:hypothetical protein
MNKLTITLCLNVLLVVGCDDNDSDSRSPLLGTWITEACEQAYDSNGLPVNIWIKSIYEFTSLGAIRIGLEEHTDPSCQKSSNVLEPTENLTLISYIDQGEVLLQEGISGGSLYIDMSNATESLSIDSFYTINDGTLCFSGAFTFGALTFGITQTGTDAIDFENCLVRY